MDNFPGQKEKAGGIANRRDSSMPGGRTAVRPYEIRFPGITHVFIHGAHGEAHQSWPAGGG